MQSLRPPRSSQLQDSPQASEHPSLICQKARPISADAQCQWQRAKEHTQCVPFPGLSSLRIVSESSNMRVDDARGGAHIYFVGTYLKITPPREHAIIEYMHITILSSKGGKIHHMEGELFEVSDAHASQLIRSRYLASDLRG
jgi:hypothetical protein